MMGERLLVVGSSTGRAFADSRHAPHPAYIHNPSRLRPSVSSRLTHPAGEWGFRIADINVASQVDEGRILFTGSRQ